MFISFARLQCLIVIEMQCAYGTGNPNQVSLNISFSIDSIFANLKIALNNAVEEEFISLFQSSKWKFEGFRGGLIRSYRQDEAAKRRESVAIYSRQDYCRRCVLRIQDSLQCLENFLQISAKSFAYREFIAMLRQILFGGIIRVASFW